MMRQYELVERVQRYKPRADEALLNKAYVYAMQKHGSQKRASGDPYFSHPLEVAAILTDLKLDEPTIAVALLHDTIEDTDATRAEIDAIFGERIGRLVEGLTKIKRLDLVTRKAKQAENLRKLLLAVADDVRVLLVKLADRLHNMRTLQYVPEEKRLPIAEETMEIYAPLAGRMGMQGMRDELEDLAFRVINPTAFSMIFDELQRLSARNEGLIGEIEQDLQGRLRAAEVPAEVTGRRKRPYSIFSKMQRKSVGFEQLSDIYAFRVIVPTVEDCYRALGVVHTTWQTVPGRFKDYVSTPKANEYRSLHTTVIGPSRQVVEMQIRTADMNRIAEYGIAAHALYKDGEAGRNGARHDQESRAYEWLRRTIDLLSDGDNSEEFLENTKLELFADQVFCFTPKGGLIALPRGATPIDFAYAVHTDIGDTCVGCKINGRIMPLATELQNGDQVEIVRSKAQTPPAAWASIVVTGKARAAVRRATRAAAQRKYGGLGRHILERAFERLSRSLTAEILETAASRLGLAGTPDLLAMVGRGEVRSDDVVQAVLPEGAPDRKPGGRRRPAKPAAGEDGSLPIRGIDADLPVTFAPNGGAVPGDRIVGILTPGKGVTIYPIQSPALHAFEDASDSWIDVHWDVDPESPERFPAQLSIESINEPGSLAQIAQVISEHDGNIDNIKMIRKGPDAHEMIIDLEVHDLKHLTRIIAELRTRANVTSVARVNG